MPYAIRSADGKFNVVNTESGRVHARGTTRANAEAQVRLLQGVEHGMTPRTTREVIEGKGRKGSRKGGKGKGKGGRKGK